MNPCFLLGLPPCLSGGVSVYMRDRRWEDPDGSDPESEMLVDDIQRPRCGSRSCVSLTWQSHRKMEAFLWENHRKTIGTWSLFMGKPQENHRKMEVYPTWLWKNSLRTGKWPIEIVDLPSYKLWWIFPVRYVTVYQAGYPVKMVVLCDVSCKKIEFYRVNMSNPVKLMDVF